MAFWDTNSRSDAQEMTHVNGNGWVHYHVFNSPSTDPTLSQIYLVHTRTFYYFQIHPLIILFLCYFRFPKWPLSSIIDFLVHGKVKITAW
jgi:hypothetical protein